MTVKTKSASLHRNAQRQAAQKGKRGNFTVWNA
jgi:hypothetical protein